MGGDTFIIAILQILNIYHQFNGECFIYLVGTPSYTLTRYLETLNFELYYVGIMRHVH